MEVSPIMKMFTESEVGPDEIYSLDEKLEELYFYRSTLVLEDMIFAGIG